MKGTIWRVGVLCAVVGALLVAAPNAQATTFNVDTFVDDLDTGDGLCSLREAMVNADANAATWPNCPAGQAGPGAVDVINLAAGTYNLTIAGTGENASANGDLDTNESVTLQGAGSNSTVIAVTSASERIIHVTGAAAVTINDLTLQDGGGSNLGGAISSEGALIVDRVHFRSNSATRGGAIWVPGGGATVAITDSEFTDNSATADGGAIYALLSTVTISNSTFAGNSAGEGGGAIYGGGFVILDLDRSTLDTNTATADSGGAIYLDAASNQIDLSNVTISGNTAGAEGAMRLRGTTGSVRNVTISRNTSGGGAAAVNSGAGAVSYSDTLILDQAAGPDCNTPLSNDDGGNFDSAGSCFVGSTAGPLDPLADNGGPTSTHGLPPGHGAIDAGTSGCEATDQRGVARPQDGDDDGTAACDSGAFERQVDPPEASPTPSPSESPTPSPTASPTPSPSESPTPTPTASPSESPTPSPSPSPTNPPRIVQRGPCKGYEHGARFDSAIGLVMVGTWADDVLVGGPDADLICGLRGEDIVRGKGGKDVLWSGINNDKLYGGPGRDFLNGGRGRDGCDVGRGGGATKRCEYLL